MEAVTHANRISVVERNDACKADKPEGWLRQGCEGWGEVEMGPGGGWESECEQRANQAEIESRGAQTR